MARKRRRPPTSPCGRCGQTIDPGAALDEGFDTSPGQHCICLRCGAFHRLGRDLVLVPLTADETDALLSGPDGFDWLRALLRVESQLGERQDHPERFN